MKKLILNLILIMSLIACHPSGKEVAGKYYAKHDKGTEYIDMKADGTFMQYFKTDTREESNEGTWDFDYKNGQWKLELDGYVKYVTPYDMKLTGKSSHASLYWENKTIIIIPDLDEYNYHRE